MTILFARTAIASLVVGALSAAPLNAQTVLLESGHYHSGFGNPVFQSVLTSLNAHSTNGGTGTLFLNGNSTAGAGVTLTSSLAGQTLTNYRVLELNLENNPNGVLGFESAIQAFLNGGGALGVTGLTSPGFAAQLNSLLGFNVSGSISALANISDGQSATSAGVAFGLSGANPAVGYYEHADFRLSAVPSSYVALETSALGSGYATIIGATQFTATPEPASITLLATGLAGVFGAARRKRARLS